MIKVLTFIQKEYFDGAQSPTDDVGNDLDCGAECKFARFVTSYFFYLSYIPLFNYICLRVIGKYALSMILYPL